MFTAIFQDHFRYLALCVFAALVLGGAAWWLARRLGNPYGVAWAGLVGAVAGVLGVTFMGAGPAEGTCVVNHDFGQPFQTVQGLWNLAMMVPLGLFAALAVRRPLPVLVGVITLPLAIEFTQATVNGLGRVCDSADAEMNILGGLLGVAAGALILSLRHRPLDWRARSTPSLITAAVILVLGAGVARPAVSFTHVDGTGLSAASTDQREAVQRAVEEAFGDRYELAHVQDQPCVGAPCTNVIFILLSRDRKHPQVYGHGTLSWPDGKHLNVLLQDGDRPTVMGYPVPGAKAPTDEESAFRIAESYMHERYPWAKHAVTHKTHPVGARAELGWVTSWQWLDGDVLMPRMLDVEVSRTGTVSQVDVTLGPTDLDLEKPKLNAAQAEKAVREAMAARSRARGHDAPAGFQVKAVTLKAHERQGKWRAEWLVNVSLGAEGQPSDPAGTSASDMWRVDAVTGQTYDGVDTAVETG
ncbi:VanZ family protein [Streptomyces sp. NPDC126499]|uniref:VanZ family protein n=1 Tax=Streptomyces sp. NPDC126499 TaxID=3155314 RepID=UPI00332E2C69